MVHIYLKQHKDTDKLFETTIEEIENYLTSHVTIDPSAYIAFLRSQNHLKLSDGTRFIYYTYQELPNKRLLNDDSIEFPPFST